MRVVDLSHTIRPAHWRWSPQLTLRSSHARGDVFQSGVLQMPLHSYTHVDAPVHYLPDGAPIERLPVDAWVGEATVVDLSDLVSEHTGVLPEHLEARAGHVRAADVVLLRTDWDRRSDVESEAYWTRGPFTTRGAAEWLADRGPSVVGYDYPPDECLTVDPANPGRFPRAEHTTHAVFFPRGIRVVEYLANLREIRRERFLFVALPLKIEGADGSPVRAVGIEF